MTFGLALPVVAGIVGVAVDYSTWSAQKVRLQKAADMAALASAQELRVGTPTEARIKAVADSIVLSQVKLHQGDGPVTVRAETTKQPVPERSPPADAATKRREADAAPFNGVKVTLSQRKFAIMSRLVTPELTDMEVTATARLAGGTKICVIGLDEAAPDTIRLSDSAKISAGGCSVYANSKSTTAIRSESNATVTSMLTCSAGGYKQSGAPNFQPRAPLTDCPKQVDPLADRPPPPVGSCLFTLLRVERATRTLNPGTYCGGLFIGIGARVTLNPGVYVIKDGPLIVGPGTLGEEDEDEDGEDDDGTAASTGYLRGTGVGFYFTGTIPPKKRGKKPPAAMKFEKNSVVEITAPTGGVMAGLLLHEDRTSLPDRPFEVLSDTARRLVGTIYLPRGIFSVRANQNVADESEYTAIVTKRLELSKAPNLVLNTRYSDTNVPVPKGLGPGSGELALVN